MLSLIKSYDGGEGRPRSRARAHDPVAEFLSATRILLYEVDGEGGYRLSGYREVIGSTSGAVKALNTPHRDDMYSREINFATCSRSSSSSSNSSNSVVAHTASALINLPFIVGNRCLAASVRARTPRRRIATTPTHRCQSRNNNGLRRG